MAGSPVANAWMSTGIRWRTHRACSGVSRPCSCAPLRPTLLTISTTRAGDSLRKTPMVMISGGRRLTMSATSAGEIWRGEGAKTKPTASACMATASSASSSLVVPHTLTNTVERYRTTRSRQVVRAVGDRDGGGLGPVEGAQPFERPCPHLGPGAVPRGVVERPGPAEDVVLQPRDEPVGADRALLDDRLEQTQTGAVCGHLHVEPLGTGDEAGMPALDAGRPLEPLVDLLCHPASGVAHLDEDHAAPSHHAHELGDGSGPTGHEVEQVHDICPTERAGGERQPGRVSPHERHAPAGPSRLTVALGDQLAQHRLRQV